MAAKTLVDMVAIRGCSIFDNFARENFENILAHLSVHGLHLLLKFVFWGYKDQERRFMSSSYFVDNLP